MANAEKKAGLLISGDGSDKNKGYDSPPADGQLSGNELLNAASGDMAPIGKK